MPTPTTRPNPRPKYKPTEDLLNIEPLKEFVVQRCDEGLRLDRFAHLMMPWCSRVVIKKEIEVGRIRVNRAEKKPAYHLREGEVVQVQVSQAPQVADLADIELDVIYEDENILVVNKLPSMVAHPTGRRLSGTIIQAAHYRLRQAMVKDAHIRPRLLHRLDRQTSGVLLISKHLRIHHFLARQFEHHEVQKEYLAIVEGVIEEDEGVIRLSIGKAARSKVEIKKGIDVEAGTSALTRFVVEERLPGHTLVRLYPHTGRGHQLRVHLAAVGHPILADELYRDEALFLKRLGGKKSRDSSEVIIQRQALHAHRLALRYPDRESIGTFTAPLPEDMNQALKILRKGWVVGDAGLEPATSCV